MKADPANKALFDRFGKPGESFDDDWLESLYEAIRDDGDLVGANYWDSGDPGAGAGVSSIYQFGGLFFAEGDQRTSGPYKTFLEAADAIGLLGVNQATTSIWVESKYRAEAEGAISLFDDLSREDALALFSDGSPNGR